MNNLVLASSSLWWCLIDLMNIIYEHVKVMHFHSLVHVFVIQLSMCNPTINPCVLLFRMGINLLCARFIYLIIYLFKQHNRLRNTEKTTTSLESSLKKPNVILAFTPELGMRECRGAHKYLRWSAQVASRYTSPVSHDGSNQTKKSKSQQHCRKHTSILCRQRQQNYQSLLAVPPQP